MEAVVKMIIKPLEKKHYPAVSKIYSEGLSTGIATFETDTPNWDQWNAKFLIECRFIAEVEGDIVAWCVLSNVSKRKVYKGVAEDTIYVASAHQGKGYGRILLNHLVLKSEEVGFWTLQAGIFPENKASIKLHEDCGFIIMGVREKIAQRDGKWFDNVLMERRSKKVNYMKNILVLCPRVREWLYKHSQPNRNVL